MMLIRTRVAARSGPWMFALSVIFLISQAVLVVLWVDVPALRERTLRQTTAESESIVEIMIDENEFVDPVVDAIEIYDDADRPPAEPSAGEAESGNGDTFAAVALTSMLVLWPIFVVESLYHAVIRPKTWATRGYHVSGMLFCICPSLRMSARSLEMRGRIWLPGMGWQQPGRRLRRRLEQRLSLPMIGIALLILPVLIVEFLLKDQVARHDWLRVLLHCGTGVIWFAFAAEFILMISVAEKKGEYIRKNWVDLAIIALPFFSFLRSLNAVRGMKVAKFAKLPQLTKLVRAYRLRGTFLKVFRALVLLDVSTRLLRRTPQQQLTRLRAQLVETERESRRLRLMIARLEREVANSEQTIEADTTEGEASVDPAKVGVKSGLTRSGSGGDF